MKYASSFTRNSEPIYSASLPSRAGVLPPTVRRVIAGVETSRDFVPRRDLFFGRQVRHYNLIARAVSAQPITLSPLATAEVQGALQMACGVDAVDLRNGIPSLAQGRTFRVLRKADLFDGGTLSVITPGIYTAGDTVVDKALGRVYLELHHGEKMTSVAVIGIFKDGHLPACVDWRVVESTL